MRAFASQRWRIQKRAFGRIGPGQLVLDFSCLHLGKGKRRREGNDNGTRAQSVALGRWPLQILIVRDEQNGEGDLRLTPSLSARSFRVAVCDRQA